MDLTSYINQLLSKNTSKTIVIKQIMERTGWGRNKTYAELAKAGYKPIRKQRLDKGNIKVSNEVLRCVSNVIQNGIRKNGKSTMSVNLAVNILKQNGYNINVSNTTLARLLRERNLGVKSLKTPPQATTLASLHPNYAHQVDASVPLFWFLPSGKQKEISDAEAYKNKPFQAKILRYVLTDHYSGMIYVKYFEASGENAANMYDFLLNAWQKKEVYGLGYGVPKYLMWDKGSANTAKSITYALKCLGVATIEHEAGNPRAKGQVEKAQDIVECNFESRFKIEPILTGLNELNKQAELWAATYNREQYLRRSAGRFLRYDLFKKITEDQLIELPEKQLCYQLLTLESVSRKVSGNLTISYKHPQLEQLAIYDVRELPNIFNGAKVSIQPVLIGALKGSIKVEFRTFEGDLITQIIEPIEFSEAGFRADAAIIGQNYKAQKKTKIATEIPKGLSAFKDIETSTNMVAMPKKAQKLQLPAEFKAIEEPSLSLEEVALRWIAQGKWDKSFMPKMQKMYPNGLKEQELEIALNVLKASEVENEKMA